MAARRLIAVMLVLLFLSSLAAALAPVERRESTTTASEPVPPAASEDEHGQLLHRSIAASEKRPQTVRARVGDQLQLRVKVKQPATIELAGLGPAADADPLVPARFDVLLDRPGRFQVRELRSRDRVGEIVVSRQAPREPGAARADGRP